ncbi:MAG: hypothetical protein KC414_14125, partial [Romboutsia sp.]|nr:hypothetical protein [Romboutsia sp.]
YPESADVLFRYRSRIVLDLAPESNFSFGGNINIYEINDIKQLPQNRINTNLFYIAFLIGKYFDTDRFFRQFPINNKLIPYDSTNVYTWVPQNIAMMIAHRRDIRSNLRLPVHELLKSEDEKDASYINRIKSGQINNEHMEEILLYFAILGNDVEALSHLNIMDLQKILVLYVKLPQLEPNKNRLNVTETVDVNKYLDNDSEELYNILKQNIKPNISNEYSNKLLDQYINGIIGYPILVDYETYKELLNTDYSILRSLYILKGCPTKRALLTYTIDTLIGLITGQIYPIKDYQDRLYLTNRIELLSKRNYTNVISLNDKTKKSDKRIYHDYAQIANVHPEILKGLIEVNTNNVDSLARLYGISLEYLNYYDINPEDLADQKVRSFENIIVTMDSYFNRPLDRPKLSLDNVKNINAKEYNDFELLELFNINPVYERQDLTRIYEFIQKIPLLPILLQNETVNTIHILDTNTLVVLEVTTEDFEGRRRNMSRLIHNDIDEDNFRHFVNKYEDNRRKVFPGTALL